MTELTMDVKNLNAQLASIKKTVACENVSIWTSGNTVFVGGSADGSTLVFSSELKVGVKAKFTVPLQILMGVLNARAATVSFAVEGSAIKYKAGRHSGRLSSVPFCEFEAQTKDTKSVQITKDQQSAINGAMDLRINAIWDSNPMMVGVNIGKTEMSIIFFDRQHVACRKVAGNNAQSMSFTVPADTFVTITNIAGKKPYNLNLTTSSIRAWNKSFNLTLPLTQVNAENSAKDALDLVESLKPDVSIVLPGNELEDAIQSAVALYEPKAVLEINSKDKSLMLQMKSAAGTSRANIPCNIKGKVACKVDVFLLRDILPKRVAKVRLNVHKDRVLWIRKNDKGIADTVCTSLAS